MAGPEGSLEKGRPLIVALNAGHGDLHYLVVTGLDWQRILCWTTRRAQTAQTAPRGVRKE
jgi:hypothetical protein